MKKTDTSGAAACPDETKAPPVNAFTQHLDPTHKGAISMKKLDRNAAMSRRQTAVVAKSLEAGKNLSSIHSLSRKSTAGRRYYSAPVMGRDASQEENDRRNRNRKTPI